MAMGIKDKANEMKEKAKDKAKAALADDNKIDKAAEKADKSTDGKYSDHIGKASDAAKKKNDNMGPGGRDGQNPMDEER
jgi:hypothetical protein